MGDLGIGPLSGSVVGNESLQPSCALTNGGDGGDDLAQF